MNGLLDGGLLARALRVFRCGDGNRIGGKVGSKDAYEV